VPPPQFCLAPQNFFRSLSESPTQTIDSSPCCKTGPSSGPPKSKCLAPPLMSSPPIENFLATVLIVPGRMKIRTTPIVSVIKPNITSVSQFTSIATSVANSFYNGYTKSSLKIYQIYL